MYDVTDDLGMAGIPFACPSDLREILAERKSFCYVCYSTQIILGSEEEVRTA